MNNDPRGIMTQLGNFTFIDHALIEEVSCSNDFFSEILVSYAVRENNNTSIQTIRLNLNQRTVVLDESGQSICLCCLRPGMWVSVILSSQMTRSNPPQANAFLVAIQKSPQSSMPPERPMPLPQPMPPQRPTPPSPPMRPRPTPPLPPMPPRPTPPPRPMPSQRPDSGSGQNRPQMPTPSSPSLNWIQM